MTPIELARCTGARIDRATEFLPHIEAAMAEFAIDSPPRQAAFLAQIGHESGGLHYTVEIWGPTAAQRGYEGRRDLGNTEPGDGFRYRGRGLIQITGRVNYATAALALEAELLEQPELLEHPELAARSAAWFWKSHGCNELADAGRFETVTRRINGGLNGYPERLALHQAALGVLA